MSTSSCIESILSRVKKPSEAEAASLSKCFPSGSGGDKRAFNPNAECVVKGKQVKKKKTIPTKSKPSTVEVVLLQNYQEDVPKGAARNKLKKCGRVQQVKLTRVMAVADVERVIKRAFKHVALKQFMPLEVDTTGHYLSRSEEDLDGQQAINRRGALYICEVRSSNVHKLASYSGVSRGDAQDAGTHP